MVTARPAPLHSHPQPALAVFYTALGASDATGVGASVPCVPLSPCPGGTGYVPSIARLLASGREVTTTNLGIPGAVISPDIQSLGNRFGRGIPNNLVEGQAPFVPRNTTLVTIFIGANDTNAVGAALESGEGGGDARAYIDAQVRGFRASYDRMIGTIRDRAPSARIVIANVPNMAALLYARLTLTQRQWLQRISVGFTTEGANRMASGTIAVVDLLCDPRSYDPANYSADGFHPNDRGYQLDDAFMAAIRSTAPPSPAASCAQMTLVPPL